MNKDKLFLATINGELVGVMTMADAIKYAWDMDHAKQELAQVCAVAIRMMHRLEVNG